MTPEQIETARAMRYVDGLAWHVIAERLGATRHVIQGAIDPGYLERRARQTRDCRAKNPRGTGGHLRAESVERSAERHNPAYDPRRDAPREYRSISYEIMGDPPIGRSALDMRERAI